MEPTARRRGRERREALEATTSCGARRPSLPAGFPEALEASGILIEHWEQRRRRLPLWLVRLLLVSLILAIVGHAENTPTKSREFCTTLLLIPSRPNRGISFYYLLFTSPFASLKLTPKFPLKAR